MSLRIIIIFFTVFASLWGQTTQIDTTENKLIQLSDDYRLFGFHYKKGFWKDILLHHRQFNEPITFIPLEIIYGFYFNGGGGTDGENLKSRWLLFDQPVTSFDGGNITTRIGQQLEVEFAKVNLSHYLLKSSWIDFHTGILFKYASLFKPGQIPYSDWGSVQPSWNPGPKLLSPRIIETGLISSLNLHWMNPWFLTLKYSYGIARSKFYREGKIYDQDPNGWGPSVSYSVGFRYILDRGMVNRFTLGIDLKHAYTKINHINDKSDITPIRQMHVSSYGLFFTLSAFYGGKPTVGDEAKQFYYRKDYAVAKEKFQEFVTRYPTHSNRYKAEEYIIECDRLLPYRIMKEGLSFDDRNLTNDAITRYLKAQSLTKDTVLINGLNERLRQIGQSRMHEAEQLLDEGMAKDALDLVQSVMDFYDPALAAFPRFRGAVLMESGKQAMQNDLFFKALTLWDKALEISDILEPEIKVLRHEIAYRMVKNVNTIQDEEAVQYIIQSLEQVKSMVGLSTENQKILDKLKMKLADQETSRFQKRIDQRMENERQRQAELRRPKLVIGLTIPQVQDILGNPNEVIHNDRMTKDTQLWLYNWQDNQSLQLTFIDFILVKIERN